MRPDSRRSDTPREAGRTEQRRVTRGSSCCRKTLVWRRIRVSRQICAAPDHQKHPDGRYVRDVRGRDDRVRVRHRRTLLLASSCCCGPAAAYWLLLASGLLLLPPADCSLIATGNEGVIAGENGWEWGVDGEMVAVDDCWPSLLTAAHFWLGEVASLLTAAISLLLAFHY